MHKLSTTLLCLLALALPALTHASPPLALIPDNQTHLVPLHTLFLRQLADLQSFKGQLDGTAAAAITNSGNTERPFNVDGNTFTDFASAAQRTCDIQFDKCQQAANAQGNKGTVTVAACDVQKNDCNTAQTNAKVKDFSTAVASTNIGPDPAFPDFDLICDA